jgi:hypothetical protein
VDSQCLDADETGNFVLSDGDFLAKYLGFKAHVTVKTSIMVVTLCGLVGSYQRVGRKRPPSITTQKTTIHILETFLALLEGRVVLIMLQ